MNYKILVVAALFLGVLTLVSCKKETISKKNRMELLTQKTWKPQWSEIEFTGGSKKRDSASYKDRLSVFKENGTYEEYHQGKQVDMSTWKFLDGEKKLQIGTDLIATITELSEDRLVFETPEEPYWNVVREVYMFVH